MPVGVIVFDVNETLLDLGDLEEVFVSTFGDPAVRGQWFNQMLQLGFVGGLTGSYLDFPTAQEAALAMVAERQGVSMGADEIRSVVDRMSTLPPHPEVASALRSLRGTSLRTAALTNSPETIARTQLENAGLTDLFDQILSADTVRALKPAAAPYLHAAAAFGVEPGEVRLVAAHGWDLTGAMAAGCRAAFVARPGAVLSPLGSQPDIVGPDLTSVVDQILALDAH